jgi:hypothetical protein
MKRTDLFVAAGLSAGIFVLYVRTLAPSLLYGDSAEFQTIAHTLGMGHPTGYPVYVMLAKLFSFLPAGEIAYRINLFSAFCAACTVGSIYLILRQLGAMSIPSLCGGLAVALTSTFWKYATIAEVYTLAAACLAFILFSVFRWKETQQPRWLFMAGLAGGLSLGIHTTVALGGIAVVLYLILSVRRRKDWFQAGSGAVLGGILFLSSFLLLDALNSPAGYYNSVVSFSLSTWNLTPADFDSPFERLAFLYFPPQFSGEFLGVRREEVSARFAEFSAGGTSSFLIAVLGALWLGKGIPLKEGSSRWREVLLLGAALFLFLGFALTYNVYDFSVYYIPVTLILLIFGAMGLHAACELVGIAPHLPRLIPVGLSLLFLVVIFFPLRGQVSAHWRERVPPGLESWEAYFFSFPENRKLEAEQTVNRLEDHAILFTDWDRVYGFYYVAHILQGRTGMSFHETYPQEGVTSFADSAIEYLEANIDTRPIYFSERPSGLSDRYRIARAGSDLFRIERK